MFVLTFDRDFFFALSFFPPSHVNSAGADRKGAKEPEVGERKKSENRKPQNGDYLRTADSTEKWVKMTFDRKYDNTKMWTSSPEKQKNKKHCADMIAKNPQTGAHFSRLDSYKGIIVGEGVILGTEVMLESKVGTRTRSGGGDMEQTRWGISAGLTAAKPCVLVCKLPEGGRERVRVAAERGRGPPSKGEKV